jgi:hypothetical protein
MEGQMGPSVVLDGFGDEKNLLALLGIKPVIVQQVA